MIVHDEFGVLPFDDSLLECSNAAVRLAACPWSPEEDEKRLHHVVASVKKEAATKATEEDRRARAADCAAN